MFRFEPFIYLFIFQKVTKENISRIYTGASVNEKEQKKILESAHCISY